jgi:hypothetical protein
MEELGGEVQEKRRSRQISCRETSLTKITGNNRRPRIPHPISIRREETRLHLVTRDAETEHKRPPPGLQDAATFRPQTTYPIPQLPTIPRSHDTPRPWLDFLPLDRHRRPGSFCPRRQLRRRHLAHSLMVARLSRRPWSERSASRMDLRARWARGRCTSFCPLPRRSGARDR